MRFRYDAKEFLLSRWREMHGQPTGERAADFVGVKADDPGHPCESAACDHDIASLDLTGRPFRGTAPFSRRQS